MCFLWPLLPSLLSSPGPGLLVMLSYNFPAPDASTCCILPQISFPSTFLGAIPVFALYTRQAWGWSSVGHTSKPWVGCPTHNKKLTWQDRVFGLALREASHSTALSLPPPPGVSWEPYLILLPEENESQNCGLHREVLDGPHTIKHSPRQPSPHSGLPVLEPHPLHSNPSLPPGKQHTLYLGPCSAAPSPGSLPAWVC